MCKRSSKLDSEWKQGHITSSRCTNLDAKPFDHLQRSGASASGSGVRQHFKTSLSLFLYSAAVCLQYLSFNLKPFLPSFPFLTLFLSICLAGTSAHGEHGCNRRPLWKRSLATNLSSSALPGQGRVPQLSEGIDQRRKEGWEKRRGGEMVCMSGKEKRANYLYIYSVKIIYLWLRFKMSEKQSQGWE